MPALRLILLLQIGFLGGFGGLQNSRNKLKAGPSRGCDGCQLSIAVLIPGGGSVKPTPEIAEAANYFLYTGDASRLVQVNCTKRVEIREAKGNPAVSLQSLLHGAIDTMIHAINFLNLVFQTNDIRESSVKEDIEWYHALVRSIVEGDAKIYRALLILDVPTIPSKSQLIFQATKREGEIRLQELSSNSPYLDNHTVENEWFKDLKFERKPSLNKRVLKNDLKTMDTPKWARGDSYVIDKSHIKWSTPFLDCEDENFIPNWLITLSSAFYGLKPDLSPEFKGVIRMDVNLQSVDIDPCSTGDSWFADSHQCDANSTQCIPSKERGFQLGAYQCVCKEGYYNPKHISTNNFDRKDDNHISYFSRYAVGEPGRQFQCLPCKDGCGSCVSDAPCFTQVDEHLRLAILSFQAFCMLLVFISMLVVYRCRKNKRIRTSGLLLLETILGGSILLYFPVFILYFQPSIFRCVLLRWVRTLGFAIIYGTVTLKIYRVLKVFLSRTAQRVPYMTCCKVLKMLGVIVLTVCWFLIAWTVAAWENMERKIPLVIQSRTPEGQLFTMCQLDRWDYMMATAEFLFLCWGSYLCYAVRTVPSTYHEPRFMGLAIHNEILMSAAFYGVRFTMAMTLHPDWMLLLFFAHSHLTVTMTLILLFIPKFLHVGAPLREDVVTEVYEDELDLRFSGSYLNHSITSAWSDHSLEPDDIRDELKKLYAQLEVHKTKKMTANNPHLQKKRSSRRALGRSIIKRISEIPESMSRQCSRDGSIAGSSYAGSYRKKLYDSASSSMKVKEDSIKHRVFSIRKSHSTYDHVREHRDGHISRTDSSRDPSLLDSLMRKKLAKKASQRSDIDSLDDAPLVYKSASAHNLTVDMNPLNAKPGTLHKSLSVVSCAREKALAHTKKSEENTKQVGERVQKKPSTRQAPTKLLLPTAAAQLEEANKMSNSVVQHGTSEYSRKDGTRLAAVSPKADKTQLPSEKTDQVKTDGPVGESKREKYMSLMKQASSNSSLVCPWDTMADETSSMDSSIDPKKGRSLSVCVGSPEPFIHGFLKVRDENDPKQPKGFGQSLKLPTAPGKMKDSKKDKSKNASEKGKGNTEKGKEKRTEAMSSSDKSSAIYPSETGEIKNKEGRSQSADKSKMGDSSSLRSVDKGDKREKYMSLMKQASSNSSLVCPWDTMADETSSMDSSIDQKKGRSLSVCVGSPEPFIHGFLKVKDENDPKQPKGFGQSLKLLIAPGKMMDSKKEKSKNASEKGKGNTEKGKEKRTEAVTSSDKSSAICPSETGEIKDKEGKSQSTVDKGDKRQKYMSLLKQASSNTAIICPWDIIVEEASGADQKKGRSLSLGANVARTIVPGTSKASDVNYSLKQSKQLTLSLTLMMTPGKMLDRENKGGKSLSIDKSNFADICPWDTGIKEETLLPVDKSKVADICPWDTGIKEETSLPVDKSKVADICPWDTGIKEETSLPVDKSKVADICPWETGNKEEVSIPVDKSMVADICPWDTGIKEETSVPVDKSMVADICPWDTGIKEETSVPVDKSMVADICPWDTGIKEETSVPVDKSMVADICPWDTGIKEETSLPVDKSKVADICPWDTGNKEETSIPVDKSMVVDICPWDTGNKEETSIPVDKSKVADICPWDTGNKEETSIPVDKSMVVDICPWDTGNKEETPLPVDKPKVPAICLWEVEHTESTEQKTLPLDKFKITVTCSSDTENTGKEEELSSPEGKSRAADMCPWDIGNKGELSLPPDKSKAPDICLWGTEPSATGNIQTGTQAESDLTSVSPWDIEATAANQSENKEAETPKDKEIVSCPVHLG
ncbi:metabotropic glycine receptor [Mustelus asterias]